MKRLVVIVAFGFLCAVAMNCRAQSVQPKTELTARSAQVDALFATYDQGQTPGAAVLVIQNGQVVHHKGYGLARLDTKTPIGPDSEFDLASTSKPFTATAVMMLADQGKLSFDDPLSRFFPELPAYAKAITVKHLLTHTSGLVDVLRPSWFKPGYAPTSKEVVGFLAKEPGPKYAPGEKFEYNNTGYVLLSLIVERVSGLPFGRFMQQNIFKPLGMTHTFVMDESRPSSEQLASSYAANENSFTAINPISDRFVFGAKGVISSTADLIKWIQALDSKQLVRPATWQTAYTPMKLNDGTESAYGFGWGIAKDSGLLMIEHPGGYLGYRTDLRRYPTEGTTVVILSNNPLVDVMGLARSIGHIYLSDKMVAPQAKVKVEPAILQSYTGKYQTEPEANPSLTIEITLENGELFITSEIRPKTKLVAQTQSMFSIGDSTATITFTPADKSNPASLSLKSRMGIITARRQQ